MKPGKPTRIYIPERGDIVRLNFSPHLGHEQGFERPAIVLSPSKYNKLISLALMCPITKHSKGYPFEVELLEGMKTFGVILSDQIKSFDWKARQVKFVEKAPSELIEEVLAKVEPLLSY
ncbi:type II toxin-antitoxin system PemK/MazF family toxin [Chlorogloea sp. CCALA 695]|uniref:type II toxin-antitoxin system PemK/MazF family toxin n=1 Tax=Chlorogloea sp. CCALA 695 TaxID=2107693 RepID=UPI000D04B9AC|nr:type II toxin-antitoxin system PemK/MazF family toxin [Chlorogloea sp. CCALA 695]PSB28822.1 mRNA-degrading endonuclease [Chlorogloea sp. CCALA 695]